MDLGASRRLPRTAAQVHAAAASSAAAAADAASSAAAAAAADATTSAAKAQEVLVRHQHADGGAAQGERRDRDRSQLQRIHRFLVWLLRHRLRRTARLVRLRRDRLH